MHVIFNTSVQRYPYRGLSDALRRRWGRAEDAARAASPAARQTGPPHRGRKGSRRRHRAARACARSASSPRVRSVVCRRASLASQGPAAAASTPTPRAPESASARVSSVVRRRGSCRGSPSAPAARRGESRRRARFVSAGRGRACGGMTIRFARARVVWIGARTCAISESEGLIVAERSALKISVAAKSPVDSLRVSSPRSPRSSAARGREAGDVEVANVVILPKG